MSSLRYNLRKLLSSLSVEANQLKDKEAKQRFYLLKAVAQSSKTIKRVCELRGVSTDLFYKWAMKLLKVRKLKALLSSSRKPKRSPLQTNAYLERNVVHMRRQFPFMGPERIAFNLKAEGKIVAPSTVAAILKRRGLIKDEYKKRMTKKHMRRYRRPLPGYLQLDIKYVPYLIENKKYYQISAIDHHSSWRMIRAYDDHGLTNVLRFLQELYDKAPFAILQIQTDNAAEFTDKYSIWKGGTPLGYHAFDRWCSARGIEHKLIPIGEKEINGKVENSHRFDDREFYAWHHITTGDELKTLIRVYNHHWNDKRATKRLGWLTPNQVLETSQVRALAFFSYVMERYAPPKLIEVRTTTPGGGVIITKIPEPLEQKKRKAYRSVDRYLAYLDWENKNRGQIKALAPMMFLNYSFILSGVLFYPYRQNPICSLAKPHRPH